MARTFRPAGNQSGIVFTIAIATNAHRFTRDHRHRGLVKGVVFGILLRAQSRDCSAIVAVVGVYSPTRSLVVGKTDKLLHESVV
jgi:hypothetical protein